VSELFQLVTTKAPDPHLWQDCDDFKSVARDPALGRHQQTERACLKCKLVKITVHPPEGGGYRLWRWGDAPTQFADWAVPECRGVVLPKTLEQKDAAIS
jgi:hypothetical protein